MRRRQRKVDGLASPAAVRALLSELQERCPALSGFSERKLRKLLIAVRHQETYSATATKRGRPPHFERGLLAETSRQLKAILARHTGGRISVQTFAGHYLPLLDWPPDVLAALVRSELSRLEAAQIARITAARLGVKERQAAQIRAEIIRAHARAQSSQTALREQVREVLGELTLVTSEKMTAAVARVDEMLEIDPADRRHLFYEQMKDLFFALRDIQPDEIDQATLDLLVRRADELMDIIFSVQRKRQQKRPC